jgi:hypothetical protein
MQVQQVCLSRQGFSVYTKRQGKQYRDVHGNTIQENVAETIQLMRLTT